MPADNLEELILVKFPEANDANDPEPGPYREYTLSPIQEVDERQQKPSISISPPGAAARENVLVAVQGQNAEIDVEFAIYDDGTDRANGTHSSTVVTVGEQINYLREVMHDPGTVVPFQLTHTPGGQFSVRIYDEDDIYFETFEPKTISESEPKWKKSTLRIRRGQSG